MATSAIYTHLVSIYALLLQFLQVCRILRTFVVVPDILRFTHFGSQKNCESWVLSQKNRISSHAPGSPRAAIGGVRSQAPEYCSPKDLSRAISRILASYSSCCMRRLRLWLSTLKLSIFLLRPKGFQPRHLLQPQANILQQLLWENNATSVLILPSLKLDGEGVG